MRRSGEPGLLLDGRGDAPNGWGGALVALDTRRIDVKADDDPLQQLEGRIAARCERGGSADTGVAALLGYDLLDPAPRRARNVDGLPDLLLLDVDASLRWDGERARFSAVAASNAEAARRLERAVTSAPAAGPNAMPGPRSVTTSLPRERYLDAVRTVQRHIYEGDFYQANLCQQFRGELDADPFDVHRHLASTTRSPCSAYVEADGFAVASMSPETFLTLDPAGNVRTRPIKGTRPRGATAEADARLARELFESEKDAAELTMIVDLERNDLGRVCRTGSVRAGPLRELESFPEVHHLVATVRGVLEPGVAPAALLRALFPGGSITGAPKLEVMRRLREIEPVRRNFFTGVLMFWGDDGSMTSSILIRSVAMGRGRFFLGAGGGVVADSDPEDEWHESNHKASALARVLGFESQEVR